MSSHYVVIKCRALITLFGDATLEQMCRADNGDAMRQAVFTALCQSRDAVTLDRREIRFNNQDFTRAYREILWELYVKYK